jgi:hypothetical protein
MFRENNTRHPDTGKYKILLTEQELFGKKLEEIRDLASSPRKDERGIRTYLPEAIKQFDKTIAEAITFIKKEATAKTVIKEIETLPCIKSLLENEIPDGEKHYTIFILARYFRSRQYTEDQTIAQICKNKQLVEHLQHIEEVVFSTYAGDESRFGCKDESIYSSILRRHCSKLCEFNKEELI